MSSNGFAEMQEPGSTANEPGTPCLYCGKAHKDNAPCTLGGISLSTTLLNAVHSKLPDKIGSCLIYHVHLSKDFCTIVCSLSSYAPCRFLQKMHLVGTLFLI